MSRLFVLLGVFLFIASGPAVDAREAKALPPLRVAVDVPHPPFAMHTSQGGLIGFNVEIAKALCKEIERDCEFIVAPLQDIIPFIAQGACDLGVAGLGLSDERLESVDFTDKYYSSMSIFLQWGSKSYDLRPEKMHNLRIAVQTGSGQAGYLKREYANAVTLVSRASFPETLALLKSGAAELALVNGLAGFYFLKSPEGEEYEVVGNPVSMGARDGDTAHIVVSKTRPGLRDRINEAIQTLRRTGEYGKINRKYFEFMIY